MGMFSDYANYARLNESGYFTEADLAEEMEHLENLPDADLASEDPTDACWEAMLINERNFNNIMMSVAHEEMQYFIENGTEMVYEGARIDAFLDKIKSLLDRAWEKIKSVFNKCLNYVVSWIATDKKFVTKYKKQIEQSSAEARTIRDSYNVDINKAKNEKRYIAIAKGVDEKITEIKNDGWKKPEETVNEYMTDRFRSEVDKDGNKSEQKGAEMYARAFEKKLGIHVKATVTLAADAIITELNEGKTTKKIVKSAYDDAKSSIASMKKDVEICKRDAAKKASDAGTTYDASGLGFSWIGSLCSAAVAHMNAIQRIQIRALNIYHSNCRKAAGRAVRGVKDKMSESFESLEFSYIV